MMVDSSHGDETYQTVMLRLKEALFRDTRHVDPRLNVKELPGLMSLAGFFIHPLGSRERYECK